MICYFLHLFCVMRKDGVIQVMDGNPQEMAENAKKAADFLGGLANDNRLMILCCLSQGEFSVSAIEEALQVRQPNLSQHLAKLRKLGLVKTRRESKQIFYSIADPDVQKMLEFLYQKFCAPAEAQQKAAE